MKHILILEDDDRLRSTLARTLERRGYPVSTADSIGGLASVDVALVDWAVVDLALPDGSGLEAVDRLLASRPEIRIVILTGYGSIASAVDAVRRGAVDYLAKPADVDQLLDVLDPEREARSEAPARAPSLERVEWEHIQRVLKDCGGNVTRAAAALGIHRRTLQRKLSYRPPDR